MDVPCNTDRHVLQQDDNNLFKTSRINERLELPTMQRDLLVWVVSLALLVTYHSSDFLREILLLGTHGYYARIYVSKLVRFFRKFKKFVSGLRVLSRQILWKCFLQMALYTFLSCMNVFFSQEYEKIMSRALPSVICVKRFCSTATNDIILFFSDNWKLFLDSHKTVRWFLVSL